MRTLLILIPFIACALACSNFSGKKLTPTIEVINVQAETEDSIPDPENIQTPTVYNDTLFLRRIIKHRDKYTSYNFVYVDTNRYNKYYDWLMNFAFDDYESKSFFANYNHIKEDNSEAFTKKFPSSLLEEWIPVYPLNGKYYVYVPSDWGNAGRKMITDSSFVFWYVDGPFPFPLTSKQKVDEDTYKMELAYRGVNLNESETITIHTIDNGTMLSVFEFSDEPEKYRYRLYIPAFSAQDFDMVVNTGNEKAMEYDFDTIDYEELLKQKGK